MFEKTRSHTQAIGEKERGVQRARQKLERVSEIERQLKEQKLEKDVPKESRPNVSLASFPL